MIQLTSKKWTVLFLVLLYAAIGYSQGDQKTVTGTVIDEDGIGIPGVNVIIKEKSRGVVTDFDGKYSVEVRPGDVLHFSFIGMETREITFDGSNAVIDVTLNQTSQRLDDVVVIGYGSQKREDLTGAIATIEPDNIQDLPVSNLSAALVGRIPGLSVSEGSGRPGDGGSIQIRQTFGFSKDGNTTLPLIVIDDMIQVDPVTGLPTLETFNQLDPSEIESITVLKDASAAIYGARASQGAVVVKTKRGKPGKTRFTYYNQSSINDAISHSKTLDAYEFGVWHNRFLKANNSDNDGANLFSNDELQEMKSLD